MPKGQQPKEQHRRKSSGTHPASSAAGDTQLDNAPQAVGGKLKSDIDEVLDEIDQVLEANAEEFVNSYIQKGGQ